MNIKRIKKYIIPIFLSLACVLTGCSQSNGNSGNNTAQKEELSLEGTWKVKDFSETMYGIIVSGPSSEQRAQDLKDYYNEADMKLIIKDKNVVLTNTFDATKLIEADYNRAGYKRRISLEEFTKHWEFMFKIGKSRLEHNEVSIENNVTNIKAKDGVLDTENKTISFPENPRIDDFNFLGLHTKKREKEPVTFNYKLENNELILTVSGKNMYEKDQTVVIKFTKEKN
jgi:lipoprotein